MIGNMIRTGPLIASLTLLMLGLLVLSFLVGPADIAPLELSQALLAGGDSPTALVAREIRLPRAVLGAMVGFVLGLSGAALQGLLRNPLAEPGLLGTSGAAAFGAVCVIYFGIAGLAGLALPLAGIAGALVAVGIVHLIAGREPGTLTLVLAGVAVTALASAFTSLALNLAPNAHAALEIAFWLMGSLTDRSLSHVGLALPFMLAGCLVLLSQSRALDALALGECTAASLGVSLPRVRTALVLGTALAVGAAVSVSGSIGFVGLVVPHLVRSLVAQRPGAALLPSGLAGACLLLAGDISVRLLPTNDELKLGVVTALIGAPFFLYLLTRLRREMR
ncbi:FecCD family ABC transporter permease [Oleisolibacter albus]|uniref:FecCD family ABC transporter permease n=1 Tax=Oleisolibacter albus TaxID=2171757 RepID=UPI000DF493A6|nr:iron ABC transporter permease [Oleisolibacter albus]